MPPRKKRGETPVTSLRLRPEMLERADAMVEHLSDAGGLAAALASGRVDRSMVLRLAIDEGLRVLEAKHGKPKPRRKARPLPE